MHMLQSVLCSIIGILNAPTILSQPHPPEYYALHFGEHHVAWEYEEQNENCAPFEPWPRQLLKKFIEDETINRLRNIYVTEVRELDDPSLKQKDFNIPNMNKLIWDDELAYLAEVYMHQCPREPYPASTDVDRFNVSQTLMESVRPDLFDEINALLINHLFFPPEENTQFHVVGKVDGKKELLSHFDPKKPLSVVTNPYFKYIGCGFSKMRQAVDPSTDHKFYKILLVCNLGPLTEETFAKVQPRGRPCSKCPPGWKCLRKSDVPNLCQESDEPDDPTTMEPPTTTESAEKTDNTTDYDWTEDGNSTDEIRTTKTDEPPETTAATERTTHNYSDPDCFIVCNNDVPHISCMYNDTSYDFEEVVSISGREVQESVLVWHNNVRNIMAGGVQGFPQAGNMREFQWNSRLEASATLWADQCKAHKYGCQDEFLTEGSDDPTKVTQLVASFIWQGEKGLPPYTQGLDIWLQGMKYFNRRMLPRYLPPEKSDADYANFVQLIWANSYMLGCGISLCHNKLEETNENETGLDYNEDLDEGESLIVTVCNYAPGGQINGQSVYDVGGPCTLCTRLHTNSTGGIYCSREYISLCSGAPTALPALCKWIWTVLIALFAERKYSHFTY